MTSESSDIPAKIATWIGPAVLIVLKPGEKKPTDSNWQKLTLADMSPEYLSRFTETSNIGVLLGQPSGGLCTIDVDDDDNVATFLSINPALTGTFTTAGERGCNFWVRLKGALPPLTRIHHRTMLDKDGKPLAVGEWRSTGGQTVIYGTHPSGCTYRRIVEGSVMEIEFSSINWPAEWKAPWIKSVEDRFIEKYGPPFVLGNRGAAQINQVYIAAKFAVEHEIVWEPQEQLFYLYTESRGLWERVTEDRLKAMFAEDLLKFASAVKRPTLAGCRTNGVLGALVNLLRGHAEIAAFTNRRRGLVHLANGMLDLTTDPPQLLELSREFFSRNQCPIALDECARCPQFIEQLLRTALDPDDIDLLQRWAGSLLLGGNHAQRIMLLTGTAGGGKSTIVDILERIIGPENTIELRPAHLNERFEIARFLGRTLLAGKDAPGDFLSTPGAAALKKLVGHDFLSPERKQSNTVFELKGIFDAVITSNSRLKVHLDGDVDAWRRRLLTIRYERPKPSKPIRDFASQLFAKEAPGILNWMLEGALKHLEELAEDGDFKQTLRQINRTESLLSESDSVRVFVRKCLRRVERSEISVSELVAHYNSFCEDQEWQPLPARKVEQAMPDLIMEIHRLPKRNDIDCEGKNNRGYRGLAHVRSGEA